MGFSQNSKALRIICEIGEKQRATFSSLMRKNQILRTTFLDKSLQQFKITTPIRSDNGM